jgi:hypothetical protein
VRVRPLLAVAAAAALTAGTLAVTAGASASTARPHQLTSGPHVAVRGLRAAPGIRLPRTSLARLTPNLISSAHTLSGFAVYANKSVALRYVAASWNLPSLDATTCQAGSAAYHAVGLDGLTPTPNGSDGTIEQAGVGSVCDTGGTVSYFAWYEMYPGTFQTLTGVRPGDALSANVFYNASSRKYNLTLNDLTRGSYVHADGLSCPSGQVCKNATAEVLTEVPGNGPQSGQDLADFGMVNYTNATVTSRNGSRGTLASKSSLWSSAEIEMVSQTTGHRMATTSSLEGGKAFSVTWNAGS